MRAAIPGASSHLQAWQGLDKRCRWAETRRSVTVPWPPRTRVPSTDYWIPLPATGSRPPVLRRRWAPAPTTSSAPPPDHWRTTRLNDRPAPLLERHWAGSIPWPPQAPPTPSDPQTATPPAQDTVPAPETRTTVIQGVTHSVTASAPPTVTRLCLGCGMPLEGKRPQAKAHGPACRQRAYRQRKLATRQGQRQREVALGGLQPQPSGLAPATAG